MHLNGRHDAAKETQLFDRVLQRNGVDHSREHAHVVGRDAVHVDGLLRDATKEVAAADDDADLAAERVNGGNLSSHFVNKDGVDAETAACGQCFARDLEEDSFVHVRFKYRMRSRDEEAEFRGPCPAAAGPAQRLRASTRELRFRSAIRRLSIRRVVPSLAAMATKVPGTASATGNSVSGSTTAR